MMFLSKRFPCRRETRFSSVSCLLSLSGILSLAVLSGAEFQAGQSSSAPAPSAGSPAGPDTASKPTSHAQSPEGSGDHSSKAAQQSRGTKTASDPAAALDFLGSYSAPEAVLATETGHTSSRPPSVGADRRLADLAGDLGAIPADPAAARRSLIDTLASGEHSPDEWFRAGTVALGAARADSRRLAEIAPSSDWNRRFQAEALAARYPLIAKSLWPAAEPGGRSREQPSAAGAGPSADEQVFPSHLSSLRDELNELNGAAENPETLYRRACLLLQISEIAYRQATASPALDVRLFALQALAAEEENDEGAALTEYRTGLAKHPESGLLHAGLGHLYRERNQLEEARAELDDAERLLPADPLVAFDLGDVELRMGEPARAIEVLNRTLELDSSLLVARWSRGRAYLALGGEDNDRRALTDLEAAVGCDTSGVLQWQLSELYAKLGRSEEAHLAEQKSIEQRRAAAQRKQAAEVKSP
jgi:hypothetical protein